MRWRFIKSFGALALGIVAGAATAADPAPAKLPPSAAPTAVAAAADPAPGKLPSSAAPAAAAVAPAADCKPALCNDCCQAEKCGGCQFLAGFGAYWLKAFPANDTAYQTFRFTNNTDSSGFDSRTQSLETHQFDHSYNFAPSIYLGVSMEGGLGFRAHWFRFVDENSLAVINGPIPAVTFPPGGVTSVDVTSPPIFGQNVTTDQLFPNLGFFSNANDGDLHGGDRLLIENRIRLNVWDFEATQQLNNSGPFAVLLSGGLRYAMLSQSYSAERIGLDEGGLSRGGNEGRRTVVQDRSNVIANNTFNGVGPTLAIDMRWPCADTGFGLYGVARGAVLFGKSAQYAAARDSFIFNITGQGSQTLATYSSSQDRVMPMFEVEGGVQWSATTGSVRPLVRVGVDSQTWFGAGSSTTTDGNLGLFGWTATVGLTY